MAAFLLIVAEHFCCHNKERDFPTTFQTQGLLAEALLLTTESVLTVLFREFF